MNKQLNLLSGGVLRLLLAVVTCLTFANPLMALDANRTTPMELSVQPALSAPQALKAIKTYIAAQNFPSQTAQIDFVREWVNQNSIHLIDKEHDSYAFNNQKVLVKLWQTYAVDQAPPHLSCGPRTMAMQSILNELGIQSRVISIFTDNYTQVRSHTFLEVFNQDTRNWEIQDPDFNLYYIDLRTQQRLATTDLLWGDLDMLVPQSSTALGWEKNEVTHLKADYFEAMMYMSFQKNEKSVILINSERFDPQKIFVDNGNITFTNFANQAYQKPTIMISDEG